jgi:hypothetical protein
VIITEMGCCFYSYLAEREGFGHTYATPKLSY